MISVQPSALLQSTSRGKTACNIRPVETISRLLLAIPQALHREAAEIVRVLKESLKTRDFAIPRRRESRSIEYFWMPVYAGKAVSRSIPKF